MRLGRSRIRNTMVAGTSCNIWCAGKGMDLNMTHGRTLVILNMWRRRFVNFMRNILTWLVHTPPTSRNGNDAHEDTRALGGGYCHEQVFDARTMHV